MNEYIANELGKLRKYFNKNEIYLHNKQNI